MKKYPRTRLNIVRQAIPIERYTAPLPTAKVVNPNNVKTDAGLQLEDAELEQSVVDRVQPKVETVRVERPINPHVKVEQLPAEYPSAWGNLGSELRRQQLVQAGIKARQLDDAAKQGDAEQLRLTLDRLLPGEQLPPELLQTLGRDFSPESRVLVALLTKLTRSSVAAAKIPQYKPTQHEIAVEQQTENIEDAADRRQEDPRRQAADGLRQARDAEEVKSDEVPNISPIPPPYRSPTSELNEQMGDLSISDDEELLQPDPSSTLRTT